MKIINITLLLIAMCLAMTACQSDEPDQPAKVAKRTVLVYMVASNSLGSNERDQLDLNEMDNAIEREGLNGCRWLVYRVGPEGGQPELFELKEGKRGKVVHETLEAYDTTRGASVTASRMSQVIADAELHAPAQDYGLRAVNLVEAVNGRIQPLHLLELLGIVVEQIQLLRRGR